MTHYEVTAAFTTPTGCHLVWTERVFADDPGMAVSDVLELIRSCYPDLAEGIGITVTTLATI